MTLADPVHAVVDPAGDTLYLLDRLVGEVLKIGPDGQLMARWGRIGEGPGEFRAPVRVGVVEGGVWVFDEAMRRVTWFDRGGKVVETLTFSDVPLVGYAHRIAGGLPLSRTRFLAVPRATAPEVVDPVAAWPLQIVDGDGTPVFEQRLPVDAPLAIAIERSDGSDWPAYAAPQFSVQPLTTIVMSPGSSAIALVDRRPGPKARGTYEVRWIDETGASLGTSEVAYRAVPVAIGLDSLRLAYRRWITEGDGSLPIAEDAFLSAQYLPDYLPPVSDIVSGSDGVWLRREALVHDRQWDFIPRPGSNRDRMSVRLDRNVRLIAAAGRSLWAIRTRPTGEPVLARVRVAGPR